MARPSELIARAQEKRRMKGMRQIAESVTAPETDIMPPPMPTNHANYTRLMRSHDRIRTRHLSQNGA